jgi:hypothetical protein
MLGETWIVHLILEGQRIVIFLVKNVVGTRCIFDALTVETDRGGN